LSGKFGTKKVKVAVGHCPESENNIFYKAWCTAFYGSVLDTKAFKLTSWENPYMATEKEELEPNTLTRMSLERYVRDYYATII